MLRSSGFDYFIKDYNPKSFQHLPKVSFWHPWADPLWRPRTGKSREVGARQVGQYGVGSPQHIQARRAYPAMVTGSANVQWSSWSLHRWGRSKVKPESQVRIAQEEAKGDSLSLKAALNQGGAGLHYNCRSDTCTIPMLVLGPGSQTPGRSGAMNSGS